MRVALVDLPFASPFRPNLALTLLCQAARRHGHDCDVVHAKYRFVEVLGVDLYNAISEELPQSLLLGDFVFAPSLRGETDAKALEDTVQAFVRAHVGRPSLDRVPGDFWSRLPSIQQEAQGFLEGVAEELETGDYDLLGLGLTFQLVPGLALAKLLEDRGKRPVVVAGGAYCDAGMGVALHRAFPWVDYVCRGEGEEVFPALLARIDAGLDCADLPGLVWRDGSETVATGERAPRIADLDTTPLPDFRDWRRRVAEYEHILPPRVLSLMFETSRGCWFGEKMHCVFCGLNGPSLSYHTKSVDRVLREVGELQKLGIPNLDAADLIFPQAFYRSLLPRLAGTNHGLRIFFEIKVNADRRQVEALRDAGIVALQPGIESFSTPMLRFMRKGSAAYQNVRLMKWCAELGVTLVWNLLYGFPGEDPAEYERMADLLPLLSHLQPPLTDGSRVLLNRFSPLFDQAEELGISSIAPVPAYRLLFGDRDELGELAYFFDCESDSAADHPTTKRMLEAVALWRANAARHSFVAVDRDGELLLYDTRPVARRREARLSGLDRQLYLACDEGVGASVLAQQSEVSLDLVEERLRAFSNAGWVVELDDRFVGLAVRADALVPSGLRGPLLGPAASVAFTRRARALWNRCPS